MAAFMQALGFTARHDGWEKHKESQDGADAYPACSMGEKIKPSAIFQNFALQAGGLSYIEIPGLAKVSDRGSSVANTPTAKNQKIAIIAAPFACRSEHAELKSFQIAFLIPVAVPLRCRPWPYFRVFGDFRPDRRVVQARLQRCSAA